MQTPDTKPGDYFVSVVRAGKVALALGPFTDDHAGALAQVEAVRQYCSPSDPWNEMAYGTVRLPVGSGLTGKLNGAVS